MTNQADTKAALADKVWDLNCTLAAAGSRLQVAAKCHKIADTREIMFETYTQIVSVYAAVRALGGSRVSKVETVTAKLRTALVGSPKRADLHRIALVCSLDAGDARYFLNRVAA